MRQIAVIGSGADRVGQAEEVGRLLAEAGCAVVCGGLGEVMAAAARGAKTAGGTTVGVLPGESTRDANEWIDYAVATGTGHARNLAVVASCDAAVAVGGGWGHACRDRLRPPPGAAGRRPRARLEARGGRDRAGGVAGGRGRARGPPGEC